MNNTIKTSLFVGLFAVVTACAALSSPIVVKVKNVVGKVEARQGTDWKGVKEGDSLSAGTPLRTAPASSCVLVWGGGNTAKVGPLSSITVATADRDSSGKESSNIDVKQGRLVAHAKPLPTKDSSFKVSTPTAVAGIRGTDPIVDVKDNGDATFGVAAGSIEVESNGEVVVLEEGFMVDVDSINGISEPEEIPAAMLDEFKEDLKEVNDEAKQAESESAGSSQSSTSQEEKKESASTESESKDEKSADTDAGEQESDEPVIDTDAASQAADNAIDNQINQDITDNAETAGEEALIHGEVEILIDIGTR